MPAFENVVADAEVIVTPNNATCGLRSPGITEYCIQTQGIYRECDNCTSVEVDEEKAHPPSYLTDQHSEHSQTWWQSVTMNDGVHRDDVNLTVNLGTYNVQGDPNRSLLLQMAITLEICISHPMLVKPKCV